MYMILMVMDRSKGWRVGVSIEPSKNQHLQDRVRVRVREEDSKE